MEIVDREYQLLKRKDHLERLVSSLQSDANHHINEENNWVSRINAEIRVAQTELEWIEKEIGW